MDSLNTEKENTDPESVVNRRKSRSTSSDKNGPVADSDTTRVSNPKLDGVFTVLFKIQNVQLYSSFQ